MGPSVNRVPLSRLMSYNHILDLHEAALQRPRSECPAGEFF
jgi:hypothetical protein